MRSVRGDDPSNDRKKSEDLSESLKVSNDVLFGFVDVRKGRNADRVDVIGANSRVDARSGLTFDCHALLQKTLRS